MSFEPFESLRARTLRVKVTRLGFGTPRSAGCTRPCRDDAAIAMIDHAWQIGVRYFDTAPLYGYGNASAGSALVSASALAMRFAVSTKVGRLVVPRTAWPRMRTSIGKSGMARRTPSTGARRSGARLVFDFSYDGVMRSVEESLQRLDLERIDVLFIHDPDDHWQAAIDGAYPALHRLREQGVVRAIGAAMDQAEMLVRFAREGEFDAFLVAGRYTLLDQVGLDELLPVCLDKGIGVVIGGVMNSGILADPRPGSSFNYSPATPRGCAVPRG